METEMHHDARANDRAPAGAAGGRDVEKPLFGGYSPDEPMPLAGYATLVAAYTAALGGFLALGRHRLPERIRIGDFTLLAVATHKLARILTKDWVTSPLRAPFVQYEKSLGAGEVEEKPRGRGLRRAMGELLTCPWCIGPWVAGALVAAFSMRPRITRTIATIFSAVAVSDALHHVYNAEKKLSS